MNFSHKFKKTRSYTKYWQDGTLTAEVMEFFRTNDPRTYTLEQLSDKTGIPNYILSKWRKELQKDPKYIPGNLIGKHRRFLTEREEFLIADFIRLQYIYPGIMIRRKHLRSIIFTLWQSMDLEHRQNIPKKLVSYHFLANFCRRNGFSFRKMRKKKRSDINEEEVNQYIKEFEEIFTDYPWYLILNADETPWNYVFLRGDVLAETGKEEVQAQLPDDYRKTFTALCTISASGKKYPPLFLASGKTPQCMQQFAGMESDASDYELYYSSGGYSDEKSMIHYLDLVHCWVNHEKCALIIDKYSSHITEAVEKHAEELGIRLVYIPTSATDKFQPLDKRVFGVMKSMGQKMFDDFVFYHQRGFTKSEAADAFVKCWKNVSVDVINKAWNLAEAYEEEEEDLSEFTLEEEEVLEDFNESLDEDDLLLIKENERDEKRAKQLLTPPRDYN